MGSEVDMGFASLYGRGLDHVNVIELMAINSCIYVNVTILSLM